MAVALSDIDWRLSGGAGNAAPFSALGGVMSYAEVVNAIFGGVFDDVSTTEASAGDTEYRCLYVFNRHATDSLTAVVVWIETQTTSPNTDLAIGLDPAGNGNGVTTGVAATIANESTAPAGVAFSAPSTSGTGLSIGTLGPGEGRAIWLRRIVSAAAAATSEDRCQIRVQGTN